MKKKKLIRCGDDLSIRNLRKTHDYYRNILTSYKLSCHFIFNREKPEMMFIKMKVYPLYHFKRFIISKRLWKIFHYLGIIDRLEPDLGGAKRRLTGRAFDSVATHDSGGRAFNQVLKTASPNSRPARTCAPLRRPASPLCRSGATARSARRWRRQNKAPAPSLACR